MSYVPAAVRHQVIERAEGRCEYCLYLQAVSFLAFEIEHIVAEKHGGKTVLENLAPPALSAIGSKALIGVHWIQKVVS